MWCVAVSHDGQWVVSGSKDGVVQFWDAKDGLPQYTLRNYGYSGAFFPILNRRIILPDLSLVVSIDLSPVGSILATASRNKQVEICGYIDLRAIRASPDFMYRELQSGVMRFPSHPTLPFSRNVTLTCSDQITRSRLVMTLIIAYIPSILTPR